MRTFLILILGIVLSACSQDQLAEQILQAAAVYLDSREDSRLTSLFKQCNCFVNRFRQCPRR